MVFSRVHLLIVPILLFTSARAQFPNLLWSHDTHAPAFGSAAAADLDQDGFLEIVFTTYTNDGKVRCLNAEDGSLKWLFDIGGCGDVAPIIHDLDGDGDLDVFVNGSCAPTCFAIDGASGTLLWSVPSGGGDSPPTVADVDGDGMPEILFYNFSGQLRVLNGEDGSTLLNQQMLTPSQPIQTEPTLVDVDGDGDLDVMGANYFPNGLLREWAFDLGTQSFIWMNITPDTSSTFHAYHGGAVADLDNDGSMEYVIGSNNGTVQALNVEDGTVLWQLTLPNSSIMSPISVADMDGDGQLEVVFHNNDPVTFDERIWMVDGATGNVEWSHPVTFSSFRGSAISDINGNGVLDLVSGHFMGALIAVEPNSGLLWQYDLLAFMPPGLPYFLLDHGPLVADFDQNGTLDVFVVGGYGTYTPDSLNTGKAFLVEAGTGTCPEWLMFRQDEYRTGHLSLSDIATSCGSKGIHLPEMFTPPPVTWADGMLLTPGLQGDRLRILDIKGAEVITLRVTGDTHPLPWLAPGIHLVQWIDRLGAPPARIVTY